MKRVVALLAMLSFAAAVSAADKQQVYKWTDANGVVHYADAPPPKETPNVSSVRLAGGANTASPSETSAAKPQDTASSNVDASMPTTTPTPDDAGACKTARSNLELLQSEKPVGIMNAQGKTELFDDKTREMQISTAKWAIAKYCK